MNLSATTISTVYIGMKHSVSHWLYMRCLSIALWTYALRELVHAYNQNPNQEEMKRAGEAPPSLFINLSLDSFLSSAGSPSFLSTCVTFPLFPLSVPHSIFRLFFFLSLSRFALRLPTPSSNVEGLSVRDWSRGRGKYRDRPKRPRRERGTYRRRRRIGMCRGNSCRAPYPSHRGTQDFGTRV